MAVAKQRIALAVEYDGHGLCGWQRQDNGPSVQQHMEEALAHIDGCVIEAVAAGRTDAGVHAEAQLVHADVDAERFTRAPHAYTHGVNQRLPGSIRVVGAMAVAAGFHARFDCRERAYRYRIWNRNTATALYPWRHWWMPRALDLGTMRAAAEYLIGRHDFSAFRASGCQAATSVRELREIAIEQVGWCVELHFRADAFLYHMVRNLVGSLVRVGIGDWPPAKIAELLAAGDRRLAAATAPAHGLYFTDAVYDVFAARQLIGLD